MSGRLPSTGGRTRRSPSPSDGDDGASRSPPAVASSGTVSPANEGFNDTPSMPAFAAELPVIPTGPSDNDAESDASPTVLSPTQGRPPSNVTARRRRPREGGSPMGSPRLTSTQSAADLRRTNSVYTVMSNDGDGYAPYVAPTELRNAIAAETQQRLELQRFRLMEGLRAAEADLPPPPLLPFVPETPGSGPAAAPPNLSPARDNLPAAAASTSIAADFLQSGFEQSYANAVASRGPATNNNNNNNSHQPSITPSATPQQRPFRIQVHDVSTSQHPGDSGTTLPGALPLSHRSPFVRPAGATIALPMPPPLPTTDLDSAADVTPRTHMNGSTSLANRSGGGGGSLLHAPQTPHTLHGSVSEAGLGVTVGQLRHPIPMDMDDEDDDGHAWTGSDHPAAAHDAASANPYRHGSPSSRLSQMRAGSVKSRASRKGGAHDGYSDHPYLVVRSNGDDAMASSLPMEKLEPIDKLPFDVLRLILIGFVDPFTQLQCRLVSTVFDRTVTSACIMWYRRIPHHVFVAHLAHRLEHEVRLLGGPGELQIFEPDGIGINWLAAHRALAETDAAAAADEAAATAAREFRHRVPQPYLTSEEDFAALHQQHHEAHLPTFTEEDSTSPAARELLLAAADNTTQPGPEAPSSSSGRPSATETQQHFTATTAAGSPWESAESSAARRIAANASPSPIFEPADAPGLPAQRDQDAIVVGIGAAPVYADEDIHLREHSDPADVEAAERKHRRERQRRQQRLHHHHRSLPDGKFGNVPSLEDPDFDSYGITFPGSSIELIRCHTFTLLLANQLRHYRSGMPDVTAETRDRWITQSCVSGCCHRQWRLYHEQQHREQHFAQLLHERLVLSGAVLRSLVFPASDHPCIVAGLLVVTFLALFLFATLVWVGPTFGITPAVQFAPLWAFFVLLYPVLYVFFGASTIEPMVLCVLGFVGITFSAVLVYFYRIVSPFKAMSWISCSTPMLLCTSCCATYSFLVMHRFSAEVTSGRLRLVASAGCSLPALLLIFACTLALELDGTFDVRVGSVASSPLPPPVSTPPPVTPAPPSGTTAAASPVPVDLGDCDGKLRFSAVVAMAACGVLFGITWVATRIIKLHEIWERFPSLAAVFVAFGLAFTVGGLAGVVAFVQGPLCIPAGVTFALGSIAVIALGAAFVGSVMAATQARDVVTGPPHRMPADLVIPMECASAIIDAPALYLRLCPTIEANAPDNQLLGD